MGAAAVDYRHGPVVVVYEKVVGGVMSESSGVTEA